MMVMMAVPMMAVPMMARGRTTVPPSRTLNIIGICARLSIVLRGQGGCDLIGPTTESPQHPLAVERIRMRPGTSMCVALLLAHSESFSGRARRSTRSHQDGEDQQAYGDASDPGGHYSRDGQKSKLMGSFWSIYFCLSLSCVVVYVPSGSPRSPLAGIAEVAAGDALGGHSLDG